MFACDFTLAVATVALLSVVAATIPKGVFYGMDARHFNRGDRVRLVKMDDPYRDDVPIGVEGTVVEICPPPVNVLVVDWDDGFGLNPCLDVDIVAKVSGR